MTVLDLLIVIVVLAAAVTGFRRLGGSGRAGGLLGLLVGAGLCSALGARLSGLGTDAASRRVLLVVGIVAGLALGAAVGGLLGRALGRVLIGGRLAVLDRTLGALAGAASALLVVWLLAVVVPAVVGPEVLAPIGGHSAVVDAVGRALPDTVDGDVRSVLDTALHG